MRGGILQAIRFYYSRTKTRFTIQNSSTFLQVNVFAIVQLDTSYNFVVNDFELCCRLLAYTHAERVREKLTRE